MGATLREVRVDRPDEGLPGVAHADNLKPGSKVQDPDVETRGKFDSAHSGTVGQPETPSLAKPKTQLDTSGTAGHDHTTEFNRGL